MIRAAVLFPGWALREVRRFKRRAEIALLAAILVVAAVLRLVALGHAPPGVHLDAAANAWNANCLLKEGCDASGERWPIFHYRVYGESRSTLYLYALLPFQAVGGMNPVTTALPSAIGGVLAVLALYVVGRKLFGAATGLLGAALLALTPWHLFLSRSGQEAGLAPLLVVAPLAGMVLGGLPLGDSPGRARPFSAALAGVLAGVACYGYLAVRVVLPPLLLLSVAASWRSWRQFAATRRGKAAAMAFALGLAATLGPLVIAHLTDPTINERAKAVSLWRSSEPIASIGSIAFRYAKHFAPDFLFVNGDRYFWNSVPGTAPLPWCFLPLLLAGIGATARESRSSRSARVALAWLLMYPAADLLGEHFTVHALRSAPGLGALALIAAVGAQRAGSWILRKRRVAAFAAMAVFGLAAVVETVRFERTYFEQYARGPEAFVAFGEDLLEACRWLRPRLDGADAVIFTGTHPSTAGQTYAFVTFGLGYDPHRWFAEERRVATFDGREYCVAFGKIHFVMGDEAERAIERLATNGRRDRVIYVLRPEEATMPDPVVVIRRTDGEPTLLLYESLR